MTTSEQKKTPAKKRRVTRQLTPAQKAEAITLWRAGSVTVDELAKKFNKDPSTFFRLFKAENVTKGEAQKEHTEKVKAAVEAAMVDDVTVLANRIRETREDGYKFATALQRLSYALIVKARQDNQPIASLLNDMRTLKAAAEVQRITLDQRFIALGIDPNEDSGEKPMPDLVIQELTVEDIQEMHRKSMVSDEDGIDMEELGDEALIDPIDDVDDRVEVDD